MPTAFAIVWHYMSQTVGLPEKDSREAYQELIAWVKEHQRRLDPADEESVR